MVAGWINEASTKKRVAESRLQTLQQGRPSVTAAQLMRIVTQAGGLVELLAQADPTKKAQLFEELGLHLEFDPTTRIVKSTVDLGGGVVRVGGGT